MKTAAEMIAMWQRGEIDEPLEDLLHAYGEQVKEECAEIVSRGWHTDNVAKEIRALVLP